jgi:hypothetical protein
MVAYAAAVVIWFPHADDPTILADVPFMACGDASKRAAERASVRQFLPRREYALRAFKR